MDNITGDDFFIHKKETENLGIITVNIDDLNFWVNFRNFQDYVKNYLEEGIHEKFPVFVKFENNPSYDKYVILVKNYIKTVWLTDEYFNNDLSFKNPFGLNWDLSQKLWNIHPGGNRNLVMYYFPKPGRRYITGVGFNTGGYKGISFQEIFKSVDDIKKYFNKTDISLTTTTRLRDANSNEINLLPHVHIDNGNMQLIINSYAERVKKFYMTTGIECNFNIRKWGYDPSLIKKEKQRIRVTIKDKKNKDQIARAFLLMPIRDAFDDFDVRIEKIN